MSGERHYTLRNQETVDTLDRNSYERVTNFGDLNIHKRCFFPNLKQVETELSKFSRESTELLQRNHYGDNPLHQLLKDYYREKPNCPNGDEREETILAIIDQIYTFSLTSTIFEFFDILAMENNAPFNVLQRAITEVAPVVIIKRLLSKLSLSDQKLLITKENENRITALMTAETKRDEAEEEKDAATNEYYEMKTSVQNLEVVPDVLTRTLKDCKDKKDATKEIYSKIQAIYEYLWDVLNAPDTHKDISSDPETSFCSDFSGESEFSVLEDVRSPATFSDGMYKESGYSRIEEIVFKKPRRV